MQILLNPSQIENNACKKNGCHLIIVPMGTTYEEFQKEFQKAVKEAELEEAA